MLKCQHLDALRKALHESLRQPGEAKDHARDEEVHTTLFDGETAALADVLDELRTYSLLCPYKIVIVDRAELFVTAHRAALERYAEAPVDHATLVFRSDTWRQGRLDKLIEKAGCIIRCDPLTPPQARAWIEQRAQSEYGRKLSPQAAQLLVNRLGADLMLLDSELAKVVILAGASSSAGAAGGAAGGAERPIEAALVEAVVGRSSDEKAWAIQSAVLACLSDGASSKEGTRAGALIAKVHELVELAGHDEVPVIWAVADLVRKLRVGGMLRRQGHGDFQITKTLAIWDRDQQDLFLKALGKVDPAAVARWFDRIMELDRRSRSSLGPPLRNLECFCATLADEV
jgi:DNA polymerase-3 subunit delta